MEPTALDPRLQVALFTAAVTFTLWVLKQFVDVATRFWRRRQSRRSLIRALYAEVRFNVAELRDAAEHGVKIEDIRDAMEARPDTIPHMTDAEHDDVYRTRLRDLPLFEDKLIAGIIQFYGRMRKIKVQIDGMNLPSYATISINGRLKVMDRINQQIVAASDNGQALLKELEQTYPKVLRNQSKDRARRSLSKSFGSNDDGVGS